MAYQRCVTHSVTGTVGVHVLVAAHFMLLVLHVPFVHLVRQVCLVRTALMLMLIVAAVVSVHVVRDSRLVLLFHIVAVVTVVLGLVLGLVLVVLVLVLLILVVAVVMLMRVMAVGAGPLLHQELRRGEPRGIRLGLAGGVLRGGLLCRGCAEARHARAWHDGRDIRHDGRRLLLAPQR